jgi:tetratricopeptide (TPR) repeat protein
MAMSYDTQFEYQKAKDTWEQALEISIEVGSLFYENAMRYSLAGVYSACGLYSIANEYYQVSLEMARMIGNKSLEPRALLGIGIISAIKHQHQEALSLLNQALQISRETQEHYVEVFILDALGHIFRTSNRINEAIDAFEESIKVHQDLGKRAGRLAPLAGLAQTRLDAGDLPLAKKTVDEILTDLADGDLHGIDKPLKVYFTCYQVLKANQDPRAEDILATANTLLQEWAGTLEEESLRESFLENVPENRAIQEAWNSVVGKSAQA